MIKRVLNNRWVQLGLRLCMGAVFVYAGLVKMAAPQAFADSIATFRLLPTQLIGLLALGLPLFEVSLGGLLVTRKFTRTAALGALLLCVVFGLALTSALLRGLPVDCGCFGSGVTTAQKKWNPLVRDMFLCGMAFVLYRRQLLINATSQSASL